jgi:hypothetical protein
MNTPARTTSTNAIVSLVFGVLSWMALPFVAAIVAIVCGHVARAEIRRLPPWSVVGDGLAVAGLVLGYLQLALIASVLLLVFTVFGGLAFFSHWHWH